MRPIAIITGASAGFGRATAIALARNHFDVVITGRRLEKLEKVEEEIRSKTEADVLALNFDIRVKEAVEEACSKLSGKWENIEVLVNNAGLAAGLNLIHEGSLDDWEVVVDTNIKGLMYCTRLILPQMVERNRGHIINLGSIAGSWPYPNINVYGGTKAFVRQLSLNLKADLFGTKVRVSLIEPGLGDTDFALTRFKGDKAKADELFKGIEALKPKDVAEIIYWVANLPDHVNINSIEVMPTCQAWGPMSLKRN